MFNPIRIVDPDRFKQHGFLLIRENSSAENSLADKTSTLKVNETNVLPNSPDKKNSQIFSTGIATKTSLKKSN